MSSRLKQSALALKFGRRNFQQHVTSRLAKANSDTALESWEMVRLSCQRRWWHLAALMHPNPCRQSPDRREGSHATPSASASASAATSLFRRFEISV